MRPKIKLTKEQYDQAIYDLFTSEKGELLHDVWTTNFLEHKTIFDGIKREEPKLRLTSLYNDSDPKSLINYFDICIYYGEHDIVETIDTILMLVNRKKKIKDRRTKTIHMSEEDYYNLVYDVFTSEKGKLILDVWTDNFVYRKTPTAGMTLLKRGKLQGETNFVLSIHNVIDGEKQPEITSWPIHSVIKFSEEYIPFDPSENLKIQRIVYDA